MMHTVHIGGPLGKQYGKTVHLDSANVFQLMSGLFARFGPEFKEEVRLGKWHLTDGAAKPGNDLAEEDVQPSRFLRHKHIYLLPAVEGASSVLRVIIGVVLIVAGLYFDQPWLVAMGAGMAFGAVAEMLIKPPTAGGVDDKDNQGSHIYNSAVNVSSAGGAIPMGYGRVRRTSSVLIATDFSSDRIA